MKIARLPTNIPDSVTEKTDSTPKAPGKVVEETAKEPVQLQRSPLPKTDTVEIKEGSSYLDKIATAPKLDPSQTNLAKANEVPAALIPGVPFREKVELPFFNYFLKDKGTPKLPEAFVFETGANRWRAFDTWPPRETVPTNLFCTAEGRLAFSPAVEPASASDEFVSDPAKPVPFADDIAIGMTREYMTDDQRFASRRPDVLAYQTEPLEQDLTLVGPIQAELWLSTSGTDADWIVKIIDVFPGSAKDPDPNPRRVRMGGYQMMVRSEVMRGRFRNSYERPEPFEPNKPSKVRFELQDLLHTFQRGHRVMVQIQSTWFPLVDRNPQKFVPNIYRAEGDDFIKATHRVFRSTQFPTRLEVGVLKGAGQ